MPSVPEKMTEFAIAALSSADEQNIRGLVRQMAERWPDEKALLICFALTCAASNLEDLMRPSTVAVTPAIGYKFAALVAADILASESIGINPVRGADLLHFWRRVDPYFLAL